MEIRKSIQNDIPANYKIFTELKYNDILTVSKHINIDVVNSEAFFQFIDQDDSVHEVVLEHYQKCIYVIMDKKYSVSFAEKIASFINRLVICGESRIWVVTATSESGDHYVLPYFENEPSKLQIIKGCIRTTPHEFVYSSYYQDEPLGDILDTMDINITTEKGIEQLIDLMDTMDITQHHCSISTSIFTTYKGD